MRLRYSVRLPEQANGFVHHSLEIEPPVDDDIARSIGTLLCGEVVTDDGKSLVFTRLKTLSSDEMLNICEMAILSNQHLTGLRDGRLASAQ